MCSSLCTTKKIDDQSLTEILGQEIENMAEKTVVLQKKISDKLRKKNWDFLMR